MLSKQRVLVTGASRGIGAACARALGAEGAHVFAADILSCEETVNHIVGKNGQAQSATVDVGDEVSVLDLFNTVANAGGLDILVHCAGIIHESALLQTTTSDFDRVIQVNLRGSFIVGRESLRIFDKQGWGRVIMIASDLAHAGRATFSPYVASKHAVVGLVRSWAHEFGPSICVNAICPGPIDTAMLDAQHMTEEWRMKELDIPLQRFGRPEEIAAMAVFLSGPGGAYITGQSLGVNGGSVMA